jgi:hypothetical protein
MRDGAGEQIAGVEQREDVHAAQAVAGGLSAGDLSDRTVWTAGGVWHD